MLKFKLDNVYSRKRARISQKPIFIDYMLIPSLEERTVVRIAIEFWKCPSIRDSVSNHALKYRSHIVGSTDSTNSFNGMIDHILSKLLTLELPIKLKDKISDILRPIGIQLLSWIIYNYNGTCYFNLSKYIDSIQWTGHGTVDKVKTLETLLRFQKSVQFGLGIFQIACNYCMEEDIPKLWEGIPEVTRNTSFYSKDIYESNRLHFVAYWCCSVKDEINSFFQRISLNDYNTKHSISKNMVNLAIKQSNIIGLKYFWSKLLPEEICSSIQNFLYEALRIEQQNQQYTYQSFSDSSDVLFFLLSKLNFEEQEDIIRKHYASVLQPLIRNWPWQKFLLPTLNIVLENLDENLFINMLETLICNIKRGNLTNNVFREILLMSPEHLRKRLINKMLNYRGRCVLWKLFEIEDTNTIKIIFSCANVNEKKNILDVSLQSDTFEMQKLIQKNLYFIELLLTESGLNNPDYKYRVVKACGHAVFQAWILCSEWEVVEKFLNWGCASQDCISHFKSEVIDKISVVKSLVGQDDFEGLDKFVQWCFKSKEEINLFKKHCAHTFCENKSILSYLCTFKCYEISCLNLYEKFVHWCFDDQEEVNDFKKLLSENECLPSIIYDAIAYGYNFDFSQKILRWCFECEEKVQQFKHDLLLSGCGFDIFERFVTNYKVYDSQYSHWSLVKMLTKWFYPIRKSALDKFKKYLMKKRRTIFGPERCSCYPARAKKQVLFHLLDTYTLVSGNCDDECGTSCMKEIPFDDTKICDDGERNDKNIEDSNGSSEESFNSSSEEDSNDSDMSIEGSWDQDCESILSSIMSDVDSDCTNKDDSYDDINDSGYDINVEVNLLLSEMLNTLS